MDEVKKYLNDFESAVRDAKVRRYHGMNAYAKKGGTVLVGSSLMEHFMVNEFLMDAGQSRIVYNRSVAGWRTDELLKNMEVCIFELEPSKVIINIGSNDLDRPGDAYARLIKQYRKILRRIKERLPECKIIVLAYYPVLKDFDPNAKPANSKARTKETVSHANILVAALANEMGCQFADINYALSDEEGYLRPEFGADKVHLTPAAYKTIFEELKAYL